MKRSCCILAGVLALTCLAACSDRVQVVERRYSENYDYTRAAMSGTTRSAVITATGPSVVVEQTAVNRAVIRSVDSASRSLVLRGPDGSDYAIFLGDLMSTVNRLRPGDNISVNYYERFSSAAMRPGDPRVVSQVLSMRGNGEPGGAPGNVVGTSLTMTARVELIDPVKNILVVRGPAGNLRVFEFNRPQFAEYLSRIQVGEEIQVDYFEGISVS